MADRLTRYAGSDKRLTHGGIDGKFSMIEEMLERWEMLLYACGKNVIFTEASTTYLLETSSYRYPRGLRNAPILVITAQINTQSPFSTKRSPHNVPTRAWLSIYVLLESSSKCYIGPFLGGRCYPYDLHDSSLLKVSERCMKIILTWKTLTCCITLRCILFYLASTPTRQQQKLPASTLSTRTHSIS